MHDKMPPSIAVIVPAFNEADRIAQTIASIARYAASGARIGSVIIADDGSTDATVEVALLAAASEGLAIEVKRFPHRGKALTVREAMLDAAGRVNADYLMMLDADDEVQIAQLARVDWSDDPDTIYIARRVGQIDGSRGVSPSPIRRGMSAAMRVATRVLLGIRFADTQCGFKLFPAEIAADLFRQQRSTGWTFDAELLYIAVGVSHLPVRQVEVIWIPRGTSKVRPTAALTSSLAMFATAWRRARRVYRPVGRGLGVDARLGPVLPRS